MDKYNVELTPGFEDLGAYHHVDYPNHNYTTEDGQWNIKWRCCKDADKHRNIIQLIGDAIIGELTKVHSGAFAKLAAMGFTMTTQANTSDPYVECCFKAGDVAKVILRHYYHADLTTWQYEQDITVLRGAGYMYVQGRSYHQIEHDKCGGVAELFTALIDRPLQRAGLYAQARNTKRLLAKGEDPAKLLRAASELALAAKAMMEH